MDGRDWHLRRSVMIVLTNVYEKTICMLRQDSVFYNVMHEVLIIPRKF